MKIIKIDIYIKSRSGESVNCIVTNADELVHLQFNGIGETIICKPENTLSDTLKKNEHQFRKVMRSALKGNINAGRTIPCVFIEGFRFLSESDYSRFIILDRRDGNLIISTREKETRGTGKIFADGSFRIQTQKSGFGGFVEDIKGNREIFCKSFSSGSSNLMELLAVTEGLKILSGLNEIQVNTDSRFVIRGLVQWVHFWRHNNWQTAYDKKVKYADQWKETDQLCEGKLIEFNWIKGHSGHADQDFCHSLAKEYTKPD